MEKNLYFDGAASALKPESVIAAEVDFLRNHYANSGRGVCARAGAVDAMVSDTRDAVAKFINASPEQIIFTNGTTDGMNKISRMLSSGALVGVSDLDHHSARLPFEARYETVLCPLDDDFNLTDVPKCDALVITAMSNVLGRPQNVRSIVAAARVKNPNCITIVDAAQYVAHLPIDVVDWDVDFLCFSGHKIGADTGVGVMYIKNPDIWSPVNYGGGMYMATGPARFEAGTLPLTQICGLKEAIKESSEFRVQSSDIVKYIHNELSKISQVKLLTRPDAAMISFTVDGMHAYDFGALCGAHGICLRVGNMCASWIHKVLGIDASIRLSPGPWNTMDDAHRVIEIISKIVKK